MRSRILVTGASGNVGGPLLELLLESGAADLRVGARRPERFDSRGGALEIVRFDFEDASTHAPVLEGIHKLFLIRPPEIADVERAVAPLVRAAARAGVGHVVFLSLLGVEKNPFVPHAKIEANILASGIDYTFLRAGFFMQNLSTTHREDIRAHDELFVPAGKGKTSFIDTRDIAAVAARALLDEEGHHRKAYDLTGGEALDYREVATIFSEVLGRPIRYTAPSVLRFAARWLRRGSPLPFVAVMSAIYTVARLGQAGRVTGEVERILGRAPISMRRFVEDHRDLWV